MPGHYQMKGTKVGAKNKKMSMTKADTKGKAVPKKGSVAMKQKMAALRAKKGKK